MSIRIAAVALLATVAVTPPAMAAHHTAVVPAADSDIRVAVYSPYKRTEIIGVVGQPTTITFPQGESVYRVVQTQTPGADGKLGDAPWQGPKPGEVKDTPLGNNLMLWPAVAGDSTMTVITMTKAGVQKVYPFHLIAKDRAKVAANEDPVYNLIFKGGEAPAADPAVQRQRVAARRQRADQLAEQEADERIRMDSFNQASGCHYVAKGVYPNPLTPKCPLSNGQWVIMRFAGLSKKPAIYIVGNDGGERLARQHESGDFVVVEEIAAHFRLRLGPDVLDVLDVNFNPAGQPTGTGTTSLSVERDILKAKGP